MLAKSLNEWCKMDRQTMKQKLRSRVNRKKAKNVLRPDLEHAKAAVLNSLTSADAQRYRHAIDEFVDWYCSEPF